MNFLKLHRVIYLHSNPKYKSQDLMKLGRYYIIITRVSQSAHSFRYLLAQSWCSVKTHFSNHQQADTTSRKMNFPCHVSLMNTRVHRMIMLYITGIIKHVASALVRILLIYLYGKFIITQTNQINTVSPQAPKTVSSLTGGTNF